MAEAVRVVIADDRARSRDGLKALLTSCCETEVVGMASNGSAAVALVESCQPDVVVMDARMPVMDGLTATRVIKERWPKVRVVLLTMYASHYDDALVAGADAFLVKGCDADRLFDVILGHKEAKS